MKEVHAQTVIRSFSDSVESVAGPEEWHAAAGALPPAPNPVYSSEKSGGLAGY